MRAAPPVEVNLGPGRRERFLVALLWSLSAGVLAVWIDRSFHLGLANGVVVPPAIAAMWAGWRLATPMAGALIWDGQVWSWQAPGRPPCHLSRVQRALDLGRWVLLRCDTVAQGHHWCGVSWRQSGASWHGLQLALRNRASHAVASPAA